MKIVNWEVLEKNGKHGDFLKHKVTGEIIYWCVKRDRKTGIYHQGPSIAIDCFLLRKAKRKGVRRIVVCIKKTSELFATTLKKFESAPIKNYKIMGGSSQHYLPIEQFKKKEGILFIKK
jgi:hypothetical protein